VELRGSSPVQPQPVGSMLPPALELAPLPLARPRRRHRRSHASPPAPGRCDLTPGDAYLPEIPTRFSREYPAICSERRDRKRATCANALAPARWIDSVIRSPVARGRLGSAETRVLRAQRPATEYPPPGDITEARLRGGAIPARLRGPW
jgi:hypothetical protein